MKKSVKIKCNQSCILTVTDIELDAIIGTGFNGDLELPHMLMDILKTKCVGRVECLFC